VTPVGEEVSARNVSKRYVTRGGKVFSALEDVTVSIAKGEFVSLCGPSGCGKTTLLKIFHGLLPYEAGTVMRGGRLVTGPSSDGAMVFQQPELLPWRTIKKNVLAAADLSGRRAKSFNERAVELLELVGLAGVSNKYPHELSGGMQQRTAIARALLLEPEILFMDEPFGALDALTREQLNLELLRLWALTQCTVVFVTHSIPEAVLLSDRVIVMTPGPNARIAEEVTVDLPRPRNLEMMGSPEFGELINVVRHSLHAIGEARTAPITAFH
jgi:NitT/TauT family transport system ATP-binding protein